MPWPSDKQQECKPNILPACLKIIDVYEQQRWERKYNILYSLWKLFLNSWHSFLNSSKSAWVAGWTLFFLLGFLLTCALFLLCPCEVDGLLLLVVSWSNWATLTPFLQQEEPMLLTAAAYKLPKPWRKRKTHLEIANWKNIAMCRFIVCNST